MAERIVPTVPAVPADLSAWLEQHIALPSGCRGEERLLQIHWLAVPIHPDGSLTFRRRGSRDKEIVTVRYELRDRDTPEWYTHGYPGQWFRLTVFGAEWTVELDIRYYSAKRAPQIHCPLCHDDRTVWIDEFSGYVRCHHCDNSLNRQIPRTLHLRDAGPRYKLAKKPHVQAD